MASLVSEGDGQDAARYRDDIRKLDAVVSVFNEKVVGDIVDAQTREYLQAFEQHMLVVQKELQALKMKTTAIANDKTKDEKLQQLDAERQRYRAEALRLDSLATELRGKLTSYRNKVLEAESERNWHMLQLQGAQAQHDKLTEVLQAMREEQRQHQLEHETEEANIHRCYDSNGTSRRASQKAVTRPERHATSSSSHRLPPVRNTSNDSQQQAQHASLLSQSQYHGGGSARQELLARLLQLRACKMELKSMLQRCQDDLQHERWRKHGIVSRQTLQDVLSSYEGKNSARDGLVDELLAHVETHEAIYAIVFDPALVAKEIGGTEVQESDEHEELDENGQLAEDSHSDDHGGADALQLSADTRRYLGMG